MADQPDPSPAGDSLDLVELVMAIEEALINPHLPLRQRERLIRERDAFVNPHLSDSERDELIRGLEVRIVNGEFRDEGDSDEDGLTALVRKLGPRTPRGQAGAAAQPEEEPFSG
jgi:hypothetical protein